MTFLKLDLRNNILKLTEKVDFHCFKILHDFGKKINIFIFGNVSVKKLGECFEIVRINLRIQRGYSP